MHPWIYPDLSPSTMVYSDNDGVDRSRHVMVLDLHEPLLGGKHLLRSLDEALLELLHPLRLLVELACFDHID